MVAQHLPEQVIQIDGLSVVYGRGERALHAVRDLSFTVRRGETVGFIGPNGAGKSSTIKTLMGFIFPQAGEVRV
ncbi:MAG: ATP-binding cassette domain-containing protein, partial [bacterium]|nr:ATP-binding cassette domain-containing protein [bacterium]